jgi:hypothetical protein
LAGKMRAGDTEDRKATDTVECGKMSRIGTCLGYALADAAGLHFFSMVAAREGQHSLGQLVDCVP